MDRGCRSTRVLGNDAACTSRQAADRHPKTGRSLFREPSRFYFGGKTCDKVKKQAASASDWKAEADTLTSNIVGQPWKHVTRDITVNLERELHSKSFYFVNTVIII